MPIECDDMLTLHKDDEIEDLAYQVPAFETTRSEAEEWRQRGENPGPTNSGSKRSQYV